MEVRVDAVLAAGTYISRKLSKKPVSNLHRYGQHGHHTTMYFVGTRINSSHARPLKTLIFKDNDRDVTFDR